MEDSSHALFCGSQLCQGALKAYRSLTSLAGRTPRKEDEPDDPPAGFNNFYRPRRKAVRACNFLAPIGCAVLSAKNPIQVSVHAEQKQRLGGHVWVCLVDEKLLWGWGLWKGGVWRWRATHSSSHPLYRRTWTLALPRICLYSGFYRIARAAIMLWQTVVLCCTVALVAAVPGHEHKSHLARLSLPQKLGYQVRRLSSGVLQTIASPWCKCMLRPNKYR